MHCLEDMISLGSPVSDAQNYFRQVAYLLQMMGLFTSECPIIKCNKTSHFITSLQNSEKILLYTVFHKHTQGMNLLKQLNFCKLS